MANKYERLQSYAQKMYLRACKGRDDDMVYELTKLCDAVYCLGKSDKEKEVAKAIVEAFSFISTNMPGSKSALAKVEVLLVKKLGYKYGTWLQLLRDYKVVKDEQD